MQKGAGGAQVKLAAVSHAALPRTSSDGQKALILEPFPPGVSRNAEQFRCCADHFFELLGVAPPRYVWRIRDLFGESALVGSSLILIPRNIRA